MNYYFLYVTREPGNKKIPLSTPRNSSFLEVLVFSIKIMSHLIYMIFRVLLTASKTSPAILPTRAPVNPPMLPCFPAPRPQSRHLAQISERLLRARNPNDRRLHAYTEKKGCC